MYLEGFGNYHQTEALPGALPKLQNSPQQCAHGLYAEQLSGTAFTRPRHVNMKAWLYRILPSVVREDYTAYNKFEFSFAANQSPNPKRWFPNTLSDNNQDFIDGLFHLAGNQTLNAYLYQCNESMQNRYFNNTDGEMLFVPYLGEVDLITEFGKLSIQPGHIAVIPRGVFFKMELKSTSTAGYLCENGGSLLTLPQLGPIGSNGLANPRHFLYPTAFYEEKENVALITKYKNKLWTAQAKHSPVNVVAWHGNLAPYCYDLSLFNTINTVSYDHPDPSIFTVLTSESATVGVANLDFVIFPPRWMVAEHTFRPPYFHRNMMSELMGLIKGEYDAKKEGFLPGGFSIHNCMTPHGPDSQTYNKVIKEHLVPTYYENTLAFMFETDNPWMISEQALAAPFLDADYSACWYDLPMAFNKDKY